MNSLIEMLALELSGEDSFTGRAPQLGGMRIFGGAAVAQCLLAAYETINDRVCHSLHCYFIHPGDPAEPINFDVTRTRDGGAFATRHVIGRQFNRPIIEMIASFQRSAEGFEHQRPMPPSPAPDTLDDDDPRGALAGIQLRNVGLPRPGMEATIRPPLHQIWLRSKWPLGDDIRHHQAALAFASDYPQLPTIVQPHPVTWSMPGLQVTSLDHAIWFHRPFNFTNWHLSDSDTPSTSHERGLSRSTVYAEDGTLVATVLQEGMIRLRDRSTR